MRKLTGKQQSFVDQYLTDLNGSAAVLRAGYKSKYPDKLANQMMQHQGIKAAIDVAMAKRSERTEITADKVLTAIGQIAFASVEIATDKDRLSALKMLGDHLGLFKQKIEHSGSIDMKHESANFDSIFAGFAAKIEAAATPGQPH